MGSACLLTDRFRRLFFVSAAVLLALLVSALPATAEGPSANANLRYLTIRDTIDGDQTETNTFSQNYYFSLDKSINPVLSYRLYLRTNINDSTVSAPNGTETTTSRTSIEPTFDFYLKNPMYNLNVGYRRTENRNSVTLLGKGRETTDYYFARLNLTLDKFPLFSFLADRSKQSGYQTSQTIDRTTTSYSGTSSYNIRYRDLMFSYNAAYTHTIEETPLLAISKNVGDKFTGTYNLGYNRVFMNGKVTINSMYQGTYSWNRNLQTAAQTGTVVTLPFTPLSGVYALGTLIQPNVDFLGPQGALIDGNLAGAIGAIDLFTQQYHNIGLSVPSTSSVDRLYVYVNANLSAGETNLGCGIGCAANWSVYRTTNNVPLTTWTLIPLQSANLVTHDATNNIYYYELIFAAPQSDAFFKAVNMVIAAPTDPTVLSIPVTEIEARGSQAVIAGQDIKTDSTIFSQGFNIGAVVRPLPKLMLNFQYSINRSDLDPDSISASMGGLFQNIFSKKVSDNGDRFVSNVLRNYNASVTWLTHQRLTTTARVNRSEAFDKAGKTDFASNTYALTFNAKPLPTIDSSLTLSRAQSFDFGKLNITNDSAVISIGSKLYKDVTMTTDLGLSRSLAEATNITSKSQFIAGNIYAVVTPKLSANVLYGFRWSSSDGIKSETQEGSLFVTYRPGRFISLSGHLKAQNTSGKLRLTQGLLVDWIPMKAFRIGLNYQRTTDDQTELKEDLLSAYTFWKITKFMDAQLTYNLAKKTDMTRKQMTYSLGMNLNCRFW